RLIDRQYYRAWRQLNPPRPGGQIGQVEGRGRQATEQPEMVLRQPDGREAQVLREDALVQHLAEELVGVAPLGGVGQWVVRQREVAKLHLTPHSVCVQLPYSAESSEGGRLPRSPAATAVTRKSSGTKSPPHCGPRSRSG